MRVRAKLLWTQVGADEFSRNVEQFVARSGGAEAIVLRMRELQMGALADSWMDSQVSEPISGEQCHRLFGTGELRAFAAKLDLLPHDLVRQLARTLPRIISRHARPGWAAPGPRRNSRGLWPARQPKDPSN